MGQKIISEAPFFADFQNVNSWKSKFNCSTYFDKFIESLSPFLYEELLMQEQSLQKTQFSLWSFFSVCICLCMILIKRNKYLMKSQLWQLECGFRNCLTPLWQELGQNLLKSILFMLISFYVSDIRCFYMQAKAFDEES